MHGWAFNLGKFWTSLKHAAACKSEEGGGVNRGARLGAVEPEAAEAVEDLGLQEADPAGVQLHDDGEGRVGAQDDVVDHGRVVAHPHVVGAVDRARPVVAHHSCPGCHKHLALELHQ